MTDTFYENSFKSIINKTLNCMQYAKLKRCWNKTGKCLVIDIYVSSIYIETGLSDSKKNILCGAIRKSIIEDSFNMCAKLILN